MATPDNVSPAASLDQLRDLVTRAFEMARERKPHQWRTMTLPVLKNRLLILTHRAFDESNYGARNMRALAARIPDIVEIDSSAVPTTVTLREQVAAAVIEEPPSGRIRGDLWNAVVDYSSGYRWMWLGGRAVRYPPDHDVVGPLLPTLSENDMRQWRAEFAEDYRARLGADDADWLAEWAEGAGRTQELPVRLRRSWNGRLKANVLRRLRDWFVSRAESPPSDLITSEMAVPDAASHDALREFVLDCVASMTDQELHSLNLPAGAVHRYLRGAAGR